MLTGNKMITVLQWCIMSFPKCIVINLKINNFKDNKSTTKRSFRHIFLQYHSAEYVSTKINTFAFYKGGSGGNSPPPPEAKSNF